MDLLELQQFVQEQNITDSFSESVPGSDKECDKWEMPCDPIPDFVDRLPDEIIDPETKTKISISQSFIKKFIQVIEGEICPSRFWVTKTTNADEESGQAALKGNLFQYLGWELLDYHGNIPKPILTATGKESSAENSRIARNAKAAQETMRRLGYFVENKHTNMGFKCLSGELDLDCEKDGMNLITDVKYSGLIGDKWSEFAWPDSPEDFKFGAKVQAKQYLLLAELLGWKRDGFSFLVFNNKAQNEGEYREYILKVNPAGINQHKHLILTIIDHLFDWMENDKFQAVPSYKGCKGCPIAAKCPHFQEFPETIEISL